MTDPLYAKLYEATEADRPASDTDITSALWSDDHLLQWIGCKAAGLSGQSKWVDRLRELAVLTVARNVPDVNSIAVWALAQIGGGSVDATWQSASHGANPADRRMAADLIGELRPADGLAYLARLMDDEDMEVVSWASLSASKYGEAAIELLGNRLSETDDIRKFLYLADALLKIDPNLAQTYIESALNRWQDARRAKLESLVEQLSAKYRRQ